MARHHNGAALKQQQNTRQLQPKTPGARYPKTPVKIPLNDENAGHIMGGAKSVLGGRSKGNENVMTTSKGVKGFDKSNFVTPMGKAGHPMKQVLVEMLISSLRTSSPSSPW